MINCLLTGWEDRKGNIWLSVMTYFPDRAISGSLRIYSCDSFYLKAKNSVFLSAGLQMVSYSDCRLTWDWTTGCLVMCVLHG